MFGFAPGSDMQVRLVTQNAGSLHRSILVVLGKFLKFVERLLVDQISLLDPAFNSARRAYFREALFAVQNLNALAVFNIADAVINGGHLVAQACLRRRNISHFKDVMAVPVAGGKRKQAGQNQRHPPGTG